MAKTGRNRVTASRVPSVRPKAIAVVAVPLRRAAGEPRVGRVAAKESAVPADRRRPGEVLDSRTVLGSATPRVGCASWRRKWIACCGCSKGCKAARAVGQVVRGGLDSPVAHRQTIRVPTADLKQAPARVAGRNTALREAEGLAHRVLVTASLVAGHPRVLRPASRCQVVRDNPVLDPDTTISGNSCESLT